MGSEKYVQRKYTIFTECIHNSKRDKIKTQIEHNLVLLGRLDVACAEALIALET